MAKFIRRLMSRKFVIYCVVPHLLFLVLALTTDARALIPILNIVLVALSVNVVVAFGPDVLRWFVSNEGGVAEMLVFGIFLSWFALVLRTVFSIYWRFVGKPMWLTDTDFSSYFIYMAICAATIHCLAPGAIRGQIPPTRYVRIGFIIGVGVFAALMLMWSIGSNQGSLVGGVG